MWTQAQKRVHLTWVFFCVLITIILFTISLYSILVGTIAFWKPNNALSERRIVGTALHWSFLTGRSFKVGAEGCLSHKLTTGVSQGVQNAYGKIFWLKSRFQISKKTQIFNLAIWWLWINAKLSTTTYPENSNKMWFILFLFDIFNKIPKTI